jgi:phosphocarrier protein HPr
MTTVKPVNHYDDLVSVLIKHEVGLHARPSVKLTKLAKSFRSSIELAPDAEGPWINAKSIVKVMAMKVRKDTRLYFRAKGSDAAEALAALVSLVQRDFEDDHANATDR